jgi:GT2 family glycosyltransferase
MTAARDTAAVAIGRNEGERLKRCLTSLVGQADRVVYVDSGSTDGSVDFARGLGVAVVTLDTATPFTAARARNAGFAALQPPPAFVQFVDGDCAVEPGWIEAARGALDADPGLALVTGWRTEASPAASAYNAMAEVEWHQPAGEIAACGGDMLVRGPAFTAIGGFSPGIIASEDEDFVIRIRQAGGRAARLARIMTRHDIAMTRLRQWWRRNLRSGHGFAEVGDLHPPHFGAERRRAVLYGGILPLIALGGVLDAQWWLVVVALAAYAISLARISRWLGQQGLTGGLRWKVAGLFTLAKLPQLLGMGWYYLRRLRRRAPEIIEYK